MRRLITISIIIVILTGSVPAQISGSLGGGLGATMPQGEFNEYTKTGFSIMGFGKIGSPKLPFVQLRLGLQGVFFERDDRNIVFEGYPDDV
ncbi:MAG: hypothetical protein GF310_08455, partial [candidate division Zixibacteria bacterium]|nr:hypothetical protein [candidate division Zixibacteria bacterium]